MLMNYAIWYALDAIGGDADPEDIRKWVVKNEPDPYKEKVQNHKNWAAYVNRLRKKYNASKYPKHSYTTAVWIARKFLRSSDPAKVAKWIDRNCPAVTPPTNAAELIVAANLSARWSESGDCWQPEYNAWLGELQTR